LERTEVGGEVSKTFEHEEQLAALFDAAQAACRAGSSTTDFEPAFVRLLTFINENPGCHNAAEQRFVDGLTRRPLCHELISFCMHSLWMNAVKREAARLIDSENPRGWGPLSSIVASFEDEWEDADMYDYYRGRRTR
jgi:hypothetical protein